MENSKDNTEKKTLKEKIKANLPLVYLIIALLALRWTIVEPYVVPTGSMEPTLKKGDRLYALKCAYDIRFPFTDYTLVQLGKVKRGDVILFRAPPNPSVTYVKRAVAIEGDTVEFRDGILSVNGQAMTREEIPSHELMNDIEENNLKSLFVETIDGVRHWTILYKYYPYEGDPKVRNFGPTVVPPGHVFAVGDNRDESYDGRFWGFVPNENLKGKAMFIWFSSYDWKPRWDRIGTLIQ